jgi:DNA-binding response OmpR family regulator
MAVESEALGGERGPEAADVAGHDDGAVPQRVLIVDDDRAIRESLARALELEGYEVDVVVDGVDALARTRRETFDALVVDVMMPGIDGLGVCRVLRADGDRTPVLMLTARVETPDRVAGLDAGADDYLPKPFAFDELVARVRALGRRATPPAPPVLTAGDVALDPARRVVSRAGKPVDLTRKEFGVLEVLLSARGAVISSEELLERVWDANADPFTTTVRVTVMTLRKKLGDPPLIETVVGAGYRVSR